MTRPPPRPARALRIALIAAALTAPACISPGCFLKPTQAFDTDRLAAAPDYTSPEAWAALPTRDDHADLVPPGQEDGQASAPADVFFVYPTVWFSREVWNDTFDSPKSNEMIDEIVLSGQASAFNACCKVYAPRYRQATLGAFYAETLEEQRQTFGIAYSDLERAFDTFLAEHNGARPFILAGHSQGSMHLMRLLERVDRDPALRGRLVAAYIPGFSHPLSRYDEVYEHLEPCARPDQTGCIAAWDTYREGAELKGDDPHVYWWGEELVKIPDDTPRQCTNPITWRQGGDPSPRDAHLGAVLPINTGNPVEFRDLIFSDDPIGAEVEGLHKPRAAMLQATCKDNALRVPDVAELGHPVQETTPGNYHLLDYELFWQDIRENATRRVASWREARRASTTP